MQLRFVNAHPHQHPQLHTRAHRNTHAQAPATPPASPNTRQPLHPQCTLPIAFAAYICALQQQQKQYGRRLHKPLSPNILGMLLRRFLIIHVIPAPLTSSLSAATLSTCKVPTQTLRVMTKLSIAGKRYTARISITVASITTITTSASLAALARYVACPPRRRCCGDCCSSLHGLVVVAVAVAVAATATVTVP
jgi:hypothetical protein